MIVYYNNNQEAELILLKKLQVKSEVIKDFDSALKTLKHKLNKNLENYLTKTQIVRDGLLGALRRVEWSYNKYLNIQPEPIGHDDREAIMLVFFHNYKCFIEIMKKCFPNLVKSKKYKSVFEEVTTIRNFFAHSYEKDFLDGKSFIRIEINHDLNQGLFELEIFDFDTAQKKFSLFFSLEFYTSKILSLINQLIKTLP